MQDRVNLDWISGDKRYNLFNVYHDTDGDIDMDDNNSPYQHCKFKCDYHEPNAFHEVYNQYDSETKYDSFFHINCRGISSNWDSFLELLNDMQRNRNLLDFIGISELFNCDNDMRVSLPGHCIN